MLDSGTRLGLYEILAGIGSGGMGEVYRAKDRKLGRDVALKILPASFTNDPERVARFRREAQVLASLNHPHIAQIHGLEESNGAQFLVLELVDGESLDKRIARGPIPVDETLGIAKQIAEALEAAHEKGIIHRDLKPANIALTNDATVKVLDFGLAKAVETTSGSVNAMNSPTITSPAMMTGVGVILGTAAYMAPEQAKGRAADKRSDIWAFGCVFYEMLTGKRAFDGEDVSDTLANVLKTEPDWSALPASVPGHIRDLLRQCLLKDRKQRIGDIPVVRYILSVPAPLVPETVAPLERARRSAKQTALIAAVGVAGAALLVAAGGWISLHLTTPASLSVMRFAIVPPPAQPLAAQGIDRDIALSPDGTHLVYRVGLGSGQTQLVVRALNELDARPLAGTQNARAPFISPDGHWVGFFGVDERLRKVAMTGGPPIQLCTINGAPRGASWEIDDTIVFATSDLATGLLSVPAGGGEPKVLTKPDRADGTGDHVLPTVLPGGRAVLFTINAAQPENAELAVLDFATGQWKVLIRGGSQAAYVAPLPGSGPTGYLVYAAAGSLRAVRFDAARLKVMGDPVPVLDQLAMFPTGAAEFAVSRAGSLVFVPSIPGNQFFALRALLWVTRQGHEEPIMAPPRVYATARLSPDGAKVALGIYEQNADIWIWDLRRQTLERLTNDFSADMSPVWTPNGRHIIWAANAGTPRPNIFRQAADGTGTPERLVTSSNAQFPTAISADGARLLMNENPNAGGLAYDVSMLTLESPSKADLRPIRLLHTAASELNADLSPDGHWLAYQSNESGKYEVYVRPFPNVDDGRTLISTAGGTRPMWAHSGRELFYLDADGFLTTVSVQAVGSTFKAGTPTKLLNTRYYAGTTTRGNDLRGYDVSVDDQRFLMIKENAPAAGQDQQTTATQGASMVVVLNWLEELKTRVPTK
jgi:serine/threonine-protein kinase